MKRVLIMVVALGLAWLLPCFAETDEEFLRLKAQEESLMLIPKGGLKVIPKTIIIEQLRKDCKATFENDRVLFEYGLPKIRSDSRDQLIQIAEALKQASNYPELSQIETYYVDGHTCVIGSYERNCRLSWARAQAAIEELVALGVPRNKLIPRGFSCSVPARSNDTEEGRQANRRIVVSGGCKKSAQEATMPPCQISQSSSYQSQPGTTGVTDYPSQPDMTDGTGYSTPQEDETALGEVKGGAKRGLPPGFQIKDSGAPSPSPASPRTLPPGFRRTN